MKISIYSCFDFERPFLETFNTEGYQFSYIDSQLDEDTIYLAKSSEAISIRSCDQASTQVLEIAKKIGVKIICLRTTGFNNVNLETAKRLGIKVARVAAYSPGAIAEHAIALILALSRNLIEANQRVKNHNFSLSGLLGFNLQDKVVGVIGTGKIGASFVKILNGFGSMILAYDKVPDEQLTAKYDLNYVSLDELLGKSDIISLHIPLSKESFQILNDGAIFKMKDGVMIINTSRGDHIEIKALIKHLRSGKISAAGLDVYTNEKAYFFKDLSKQKIDNEDLLTLIDMDNVLLTGHQAFLTETALSNIAKTTLDNINRYQNKTTSNNFLI